MANLYVCYMSIFPEFIYVSRYPILIFNWSIVLFLSSSYIKNDLFLIESRVKGREAVALPSFYLLY